jgi:hypothetical protein
MISSKTRSFFLSNLEFRSLGKQKEKRNLVKKYLVVTRKFENIHSGLPNFHILHFFPTENFNAFHLFPRRATWLVHLRSNYLIIFGVITLFLRNFLPLCDKIVLRSIFL